MKNKLTRDFLKYDIILESSDIASFADEPSYKKIIPQVAKEIRQSNETSRRNLSKIANVVLDGDVSEDGISNNKWLSDFQDTAYQIMESLKDDNDFVLLERKNLNAILAGSVTVLDSTDTYYKSTERDKNGKFVRTSPRNIVLHLDHLFSTLKDSFLIGKAFIEKDLFTFVFTVFKAISGVPELLRLEFDKNCSIVLLYLAKFAPIDEEELRCKINDHVLNFMEINEEYANIQLSTEQLAEILNYLERIKVIQLLEGHVYLIEKVYL